MPIMPAKLFSLHNVPDDEAEEVRDLLRSNEIDFHETPAGNWGISVAYIWLHDENQLEKAKALIADYQQERLIRAREEYAQLVQTGKRRTMGDVIRENPLRFVVYLAAIAAVLYFSTRPFINIGK